MQCSSGIKLRSSDINDLPNCLDHSEPSMFADDNNITMSANSVDYLESKLNSDLDNIHQWLVANMLSLNVSKTEYIIIHVGSRHNLNKIIEGPIIKIGDQLVNRVYTTKSLVCYR